MDKNMTISAPHASKRMKFTSHKREELFAAYESSEQSIADFVRDYGINYQTGCNWLRKGHFASSLKPVASKTARFVQVRPMQEAAI